MSGLMVGGFVTVAATVGFVVRGGADVFMYRLRVRHVEERAYWRGYVAAVAEFDQAGVKLVAPVRELPSSGVPDGMAFDPFGWSDADDLAMITWQGEDL